MSENLKLEHPPTEGNTGLEHHSHGGAMSAFHAPQAYRVLPRRAGALMIDSVLWGIAIVGLAISAGRSTEPVFQETTGGLVLSEQVTFHLSFIQIWSITILWFSYLIFSESLFGSTLGKKAAAISVYRADGTAGGLWVVVLRHIPRFAIVSLVMFLSLYPLVPIVFLVDALIARFNDRRQGVGDLIAGTVVVRADLLRTLTGGQGEDGEWASIDVMRPYKSNHTSAAGTQEYAGFWRRAFAVVIDGLVLGVLLAVASFMPSMSSRLGGFGDVPGASDWPFEIFLSLFSFGYFAYLNGRGATLGKMLLGIRVIDTAGRSPGFRKGVIRQIIPGAGALVPYVPRIVSIAGSGAWSDNAVQVVGISLIVVFAYFLFALYDALSMLWNDHRQTIHDRMAGTFVVRTVRAHDPQASAL